MKTIALSIALVVLALATSADAPYKLHMRDGTVLVVDKAPEVRGDLAAVTRNGMEYLVQAGEIDFAASEKANPPAPAEGAGEAPATPKRYTNEDLDRLRETAPLANEGGASPGTVPRTPPSVSERRPNADARLAALYRREDDLQKDRAGWLDRLDDFQEQYDALLKEEEQQNYMYSRQAESSVRGQEQARWQKEQATRKARAAKAVAEAKEKVRQLDAKLEDVRRDILEAYERAPER
jgi:hypothetical protein